MSGDEIYGDEVTSGLEGGPTEAELNAELDPELDPRAGGGPAPLVEEVDAFLAEHPILRKCIGSARFGIEPHEAPVGDFSKQPSQKDGLSRLCTVHWKIYVASLARDRAAAQGVPVSVEVTPRGKRMIERQAEEVLPAKIAALQKRVTEVKAKAVATKAAFTPAPKPSAKRTTSRGGRKPQAIRTRKSA